MGAIAEVRDAVKLIADLVEQTRTILSALEDGSEYLQKHHPAATTQVAELMEQMRVTVAGAISVTRIVADFDFTVEGTDVDRQPARFNDHLIRVDEQMAINPRRWPIGQAATPRRRLLLGAMAHTPFEPGGRFRGAGPNVGYPGLSTLKQVGLWVVHPMVLCDP